MCKCETVNAAALLQHLRHVLPCLRSESVQHFKFSTLRLLIITTVLFSIGLDTTTGAMQGDTAAHLATLWGPHFDFIRTAEELRCTPATFKLSHMRDVAGLINAFEHRAAALLVRTVIAGGAVPNALASCAQWEGIRAATAFGELLIVKAFAQGLRETEPVVGVETQQTLVQLFMLFTLGGIEKNGAEFMMDGYLSPQDFAHIQEEVKHLLTEIRPSAVSLTDAFGFTDTELNSAIGQYSGNVYPTLLEWAKLEPLNRGAVVRGWEKHYGKTLEEGRKLLLDSTGTLQRAHGSAARCAQMNSNASASTGHRDTACIYWKSWGAGPRTLSITGFVHRLHR
eukprot:m.842684 g.842684  ORF g.842684 m.842684 type:complete len:339 (+) comp23470_c1_seq80:2079-3095(+)